MHEKSVLFTFGRKVAVSNPEVFAWTTLDMKEKPNGGFSWPESERSSIW